MVEPAHYATIPLFCPTEQLLFGISEIKNLMRPLLCMGLFSAFLFGHTQPPVQNNQAAKRRPVSRFAQKAKPVLVDLPSQITKAYSD